MREVALASRVENKGIIDFLYMNIKNRIDFCKTIITNYCDNNFCYLLFACEDEFVNVCEEIMRDVVIDYIEGVYKVNFLKKTIKNPLRDTLAFNAYIKVLSIFDKTTDANALNAIDTVKEAIQMVSTQRSSLGAVQNRLEHTIANLDNVVENTTAAESQIRDTDMATEMVRYSNNNILAQAGQAMLAQANQANQGVLSLLQ